MLTTNSRSADARSGRDCVVWQINLGRARLDYLDLKILVVQPSKPRASEMNLGQGISLRSGFIRNIKWSHLLRQQSLSLFISNVSHVVFLRLHCTKHSTIKIYISGDQDRDLTTLVHRSNLSQRSLRSLRSQSHLHIIQTCATGTTPCLPSTIVHQRETPIPRHWEPETRVIGIGHVGWLPLGIAWDGDEVEQPVLIWAI